MIVHTLIFSFGHGRTPAEQDKFLATVAEPFTPVAGAYN